MSDLQPTQPPNDSAHGERWREVRHRDPIGRAMGGMVLILLGVVFFIAQSNWFGVTWSNMWGAFLIGMGGLLLLQALLRFVLPGDRRNVFGLVIGGFVLIAIGMIPYGGTAWALWWPLGLILIGAVMLLQQFTR